MAAETERYEKIRRLADEAGFSCAPLDPSTLVPDPAVRAMCAEDRCRRYGASWSCPPACGSLETLGKRMHRYSDGILLVSVMPVEGDFDIEGIREGEILHKKRFDTLVRQVRTFCPDILPLASGSCTRCAKCTYPDAPCRFPDRLWPSMEACGLFVSRVCESCGMRYNNGPGTITFVSCILFQR